MRPTQSTSNNALTPQLTPNPQPREDPSSIELLNLLRRRLSIARTHIVAQTIMAQKDEEGNFSWVEFEPRFHSHLVKCAFSLLNAPITHSAQKQLKKALFIFILEILNQEYEDTFFAPKCRENCAPHEKKRLACKHRHDKKQKQKHSCDDNKLAGLPPTPKMAPLADAEVSDTPPTPTSSTLLNTTLQDHTTLLAAPAILAPSPATLLSRKPQTPPPPNPCPTPTIPTVPTLPAPLISTQTPPIPPATVPPPLVPMPSTPAPRWPTRTPRPYPATEYQLFVLQMNDDVDDIMFQWKEKTLGKL